MPFAYGIASISASLARPLRSRKVVEDTGVEPAFEALGDPLLYYEQYGAPRSDMPELNLRRAFLLQAWMDYSRPTRQPAMTAVDRFQLRAWIAGKYPDGTPYKAQRGWNFVDICDALGFDARLARKAILAHKRPSVAGIRGRSGDNRWRVNHARRRKREHVAD